MPNNDEWRSKISRQIADGSADEIWITKFDLNYEYGQLELSKRAMKLCFFAVTGGNFTGYHRVLNRFYGLTDIPKIFHEKLTKHWKTSTQFN